MSLGTDFEFAVTTPDRDGDIDFLGRLGFERLDEKAGWVRLGDGAVKIALRAGDTKRTTLVLDCPDLAAARRQLTDAGVAVAAGPSGGPFGDGDALEVSDPDGQSVVFAAAGNAAGERAGQHEGRLCGLFGEFSLETRDVGVTDAFWRKLGFAPTQYAPDPVTNWTSLSDGLLMVGLYNVGHVPHVFDTPTITYFDAGMQDKLSAVRDRGVAFQQTLETEGEPQNAVVRAPGGQMFFLFSG